MKTRGAASKTAQGTQQQPAKASATERPRLISKSLILPSNASEDARLVRLESPRTGELSRYYLCPKLGLYEFTAITSPSSQRSMLFVSSSHNSAEDSHNVESRVNGADSHEAGKNTDKPKQQNGLTSKVAQLLVATPIDMIFFLLPILDSSSTSKPARNLFQPLDDMIDERDDISPHLRRILLQPEFKSVVDKRMNAICDTVDAGETMYRFSEEKLVKELMRKAERMVKSGLPPTLEERFVRQALELPITSVARENAVNEKSNGGSNKADGSQESTETTASGTSADTTLPTSPESPDQSTSTSKFQRLLRLRTALSFILSSYVSPQLSARVEKALTSPTSPVDFAPLTSHLSHIAKLRAEAFASRSMFDMTRKRGLEDEDADDERAEKKRKQQEEEKRKKAGESRAVKELKKVNTSGMKKLSAFFGKSTRK